MEAARPLQGLADAAPRSERELVGVARRDPEAFGEIYRRHYGAIGTYLYRRTGDRHATEDLLAEVFLSALRGIRRFRWRGIDVRHWLYRIATRAANRWAKRARRVPAPLPPEVPDPRDPSHDDAEEVTALLLRLPPKLQAAVTLHYLEGLPVAEVARVLGVAPGTVKSRLSRARDAMREGGSA
jgi:RNA polymerase sigma-70 factor (ECF subfamily)